MEGFLSCCEPFPLDFDNKPNSKINSIQGVERVEIIRPSEDIMMITAGVETTTKIYEWKRRSRSSPYKFELVQSIQNHRLKTRNTASYAQLNGFGLFRCEHRTSERVVGVK